MPASATAFPAGLITAFDLSVTPAMSVRRSAGPNPVDVLPETQSDSFEDLLGLAVAGAPLNVVGTQPTLYVPAPAPDTSVVQVAAGGSADSAQRASLLAAITQHGRLPAPSSSPFPVVGEIAPDRESGADADSATVSGGPAPELARTINSEPAFVPAFAPNDDVSTNVLSAGEAADRDDIGESVIAGRTLVFAQSTAAEGLSATDDPFEAVVQGPAPERTDQSDEFAAAADVDSTASSGSPIQDAALPLNAVTGGDDDAVVAATERLTEGLRPVSELVQDVQTVPQPETPVETMPAAIAAETPVVPPAVIAGGVTQQVTPAADGRPQTAADDAIGIHAAAARSSHDSRDGRTETADAPPSDVTTAAGGITEHALESAQATSTPSDDRTPSDENSNAGARADASALTPPGSTSAIEAPAPRSGPAADGGSVLRQISDAVQTWGDALQEQGTARFTAWLTPPELGSVWVELTRSADGITARLSAADDSVQSLLESQAPELRQALADSGVNISELDFSGRSTADSGSQQQQQPPPDRREEVEVPDWHVDGGLHRRSMPRRSGAVDVRV